MGSWALCQEALPVEVAGTSGHFLVVQHMVGSLKARVDELSR